MATYTSSAVEAYAQQGEQACAACRRIARICGWTTFGLVVLAQAAAFLALVQQAWTAAEALWPGVLPVIGPAYACYWLAVRGDWACFALALLLMAAVWSLTVAVRYGKQIRQIQQDIDMVTATAEVAVRPFRTETVSIAMPRSPSAVLPARPEPTETPAPTAPTAPLTAEEEASMQAARREYEAAQARIAEILKHK